MKATRTLEKTNDRTEKAFDCHRASCRRIFACDGAERCSDWWLSASNGRRGRQSCSTRTSLLSRRKIRWFRNFVSSADQAPHKDLHVSKVAAVEWSAGRLTQFRSSERFRARRFPPPWSVEVSVDDLRYCSRCERSRLLLQSFSALRLRWHRQHPGRPNIVARRKPIRRLITRSPAVHPPAASRLVPRVYRQTRLVGQGRMTGDKRRIGGH